MFKVCNIKMKNFFLVKKTSKKINNMNKVYIVPKLNNLFTREHKLI